MNVGTLKENTNQETGQLFISGHISTYKMHMPIRLEMVTNRMTNDSPTHVVLGKGVHGQYFQAGVAWQGETKQLERMFTISMTIPDLEMHDVRYVAFKQKDGSFDIRVSKPVEEQKQVA